MRVFIVGMPGSGRTTVARALCQAEPYRYIDSISWVKGTFRSRRSGEHPDQYHDAYHEWFVNRMKADPFIGTDNVFDSIEAYEKSDKKSEVEPIYVIDGVSSPRDFSELFDYNEDFVVFLNRTDNNTPHKDYENVGVSVMRDYCYWMSSADLLSKNRWHEYNFKMSDAPGDLLKAMGSKNSVFVVKSLAKVIEHLQSALKLIHLEES